MGVEQGGPLKTPPTGGCFRGTFIRSISEFEIQILSEYRLLFEPQSYNRNLRGITRRQKEGHTLNRKLYSFDEVGIEKLLLITVHVIVYVYTYI